MKKINGFFFFIFCSLICPFFINGLAQYASAADSAEITQIDQQVILQKKKIERVQSGIASHQNKVSASRKRETLLLAELEKIERQVQAENEKLVILQTEMARQQEITDARKNEIVLLDQEKNALRNHMEKRLQAYYRMGNIGFLNAIFSSTSLSDLVSFREYFQLMLQYDRQVIDDFKKKMSELEVAQKAHEKEKERLAGAAEDVKRQQAILNQTQQERLKLLERVKTERHLYQQALQELEEAASQLTATLSELEQKATEAKEERENQFIKDYPLKPFKKRKPSSARGFSGQKGKLPLPAPGGILKKYTGDTYSSPELATSTNGINIESPPGSNIIAVYNGRVVYTGTLRTYGNLIIIDHGNHFYSLVSGVGEILSKVGEVVKQGDRIGITSLHTGILQENLHFEIRYNTETQDPLEWLNPAQIVFSNNTNP